MNTVLLALVAILGGSAIVLQSQFMGLMDTQLGTLESVFITYGGGGAVVSLIMLASRSYQLRNWQSLPWYVYTSGLLGLVIVGVISYVVPRLGLATTFTLMVGTQFVLGLLVDQYGFLGAEVYPVTAERLVGLGLLLTGVILIIR